MLALVDLGLPYLAAFLSEIGHRLSHVLELCDCPFVQALLCDPVQLVRCKLKRIVRGVHEVTELCKRVLLAVEIYMVGPEVRVYQLSYRIDFLGILKIYCS